MIKEALALKNALSSYGSQIKNKRIEAKVDNQAVVFAWKNQYSKNGILSSILKNIFQLTIQNNCYLNLSYIRTSENLSDVLSRGYSKSDATLSNRAWVHIHQSFGPHDVDMFSLDSNAMFNNIGDPLAHFTPFPTPETSGVDAFAQSYSWNKLYYAFPPFCLLETVVNLILQEKINCTLVFPEFKPIQPWFTVIMSKTTEIIPIGFKGDTGVLLFPSKKGFLPDKNGLQWNMLAAHFCFSVVFSLQHNVQISNFSCPKDFIPVLFIGDSMIRFLTGVFNNVHVVSVGAAKLLSIFHCLVECSKMFNTFVVILHAGTNDVNKCNKPSQMILFKAKQDCSCIVVSIARLREIHRSSFVFSGCIKTCNDLINSRISEVNTFARHLCTENKFLVIDHSNISSQDLKDFVHLNDIGEKTFVENLRCFLQ